jgi:hypothetical protein
MARVHGEEASQMIDAKIKEHFPDGIPCGRDISTDKGDYDIKEAGKTASKMHKIPIFKS